MIKFKKCLPNMAQGPSANYVEFLVRLRNKSLKKILSPFILSIALFGAGCAGNVTFPADTIVSSIESICKDLYSMQVTADVTGKSIGALLYVDKILDETGTAMRQDMNELIGNLTLSIRRVALSTDKDVEFIVIVIRGRAENLEIRMIRNVSDIRKASAEALSITESMNRTVFQQALYEDGDEAQLFDLPNLTIEDFVVMQALQRAKQAGSTDEDTGAPTVLFDGQHVRSTRGSRYEFSILNLNQEQGRTNLGHMVQAVADVLVGYDTEEYEGVVIRDLLDGKILIMNQDLIKDMRKKKISVDQVIDKRLQPDSTRSKAIRDALQIFGFQNSSNDDSEKSDSGSQITIIHTPASDEEEDLPTDEYFTKD